MKFEAREVETDPQKPRNISSNKNDNFDTNFNTPVNNN